MVNANRKEIVRRLSEADGPLSGEKLSGELGISRVAVWKQIKGLIGSGWPVETTSRGYLLRGLPDTLDDWSFPSLSLTVHHFVECISTMETARILFMGRPLPYAVVADRQTGGMDHDHGEWRSPGGGIYLTLVIPSRFPYDRAAEYNRLGVSASARAIGEVTGLACRVEPPARLWLGESCVGGVMTELYGPFDNPAAAAIGIGIHVNRAPLPETAGTLAESLGHELSRRTLLAALLTWLTASFDKEI